MLQKQEDEQSACDFLGSKQKDEQSACDLLGSAIVIKKVPTKLEIQRQKAENARHRFNNDRKLQDCSRYTADCCIDYTALKKEKKKVKENARYKQYCNITQNPVEFSIWISQTLVPISQTLVPIIHNMPAVVVAAAIPDVVAKKYDATEDQTMAAATLVINISADSRTVPDNWDENASAEVSFLDDDIISPLATPPLATPPLAEVKLKRNNRRYKLLVPSQLLTGLGLGKKTVLKSSI